MPGLKRRGVEFIDENDRHLASGKGMTIEKALRVIADLAEKKVIKNYAITAAVAALNYVEASATEDVDVLVSASNFPQPPSGLILLGSLEAALAERGYFQRTDAGIVVENWPVQFIPAASPLEEEAIEGAAEVNIGTAAEPMVTRVLSAEHVVAIALKTGRPKDLARIAQFLEQDVLDFDALKGVLHKHDLLELWADYCRRFRIADPLAKG